MRTRARVLAASSSSIACWIVGASTSGGFSFSIKPTGNDTRSSVQYSTATACCASVSCACASLPFLTSSRAPVIAPHTDEQYRRCWSFSLVTSRSAARARVCSECAQTASTMDTHANTTDTTANTTR